MRKLVLLFLSLVVLFLLLFGIGVALGWEDESRWLGWFKVYETRIGIWSIVIFLLCLDLIFPVPSSLTMMFAGRFLGIWEGCLAAFSGSMICSLMGYGLGTIFGRQRWFRQWLGKEEEVQLIRSWLEQYGGWILFISRPIPMLTEITACLSGITGYPFPTFLLWVASGTLPVAWLYAFFGYLGQNNELWPWLIVGLGLPGMLIFLVRYKISRRYQSCEARTVEEK